MYKGEKVTVIIGAAGSGSRMGGPLPKQFLKIGGRTILERAIEPFENLDYVDDILVVTNQDFVVLSRGICSRFNKVGKVIVGGSERQDSIYEALKNIGEEGYVLIHDGVRPYVTHQVIINVLEDAARSGAAVAAVPSKDTIRQLAEKGESLTLDRKTLYNVQTPQGFRTPIIKEAYKKAYEYGAKATDDGALAERIGYKVALSQGDYANIKITTKEDLPMEFRIGSGYDVHQLTEGRPLILGGVNIPYEKGLLGHSDADVLIHALMDAMLGAAALGDIGRHFPDSDSKYKGISSMKLLDEVGRLIQQKEYFLGNADITVIAQKPKLSPYIGQMEENIAATLKVDKEKINIKATTTENLGFEGRGQGIAAQAVCTLTRK